MLTVAASARWLYLKLWVAVIGCIDEEDEPKEAVCKVCNKSLEVDAYSHKQWKRCRYAGSVACS